MPNNFLIKCLVYFVLVVQFSAFAQAETDQVNPSGVSTVIFPTKLISSTDAPIRIDTGNLRGDQLGKWFGQVRDYLPSGALISVDAYMPDGLSAEEELKFVEYIKSSLQSTYPDAVINPVRVKIADIDAHIAESNIELAAEKLRTNPVSPPQIVESAIQENRNTLINVKTWQSGFRDFIRNLHTPETNLLIGNVLSKSRGVLGGALLITGAGLNWFSAAAAMMETFVVYKMNRIGIRQHDFINERLRIPIAKNFPLVRIFNSSMLVRSMVYSFAVWNLSYRSFKKGLLYLGDPTKLLNPISSAGLWESISVGGFNAVIGALGNTGISSLGNKGYISKMSQNYMLWSIGLIGQFGASFQLTEHFELAKWTLGAAWTASGIVWAASKLLPTKNNKIVAIHPAIDSDRIADIKKLEGITTTLQTQDFATEDLQKELIKLESELRIQERTPTINEYLREAITKTFSRVSDWCTGLAIQSQYLLP